MTTTTIEKALQILNAQDWYWMMSDSNSAYCEAKATMRAFVELVKTIKDSTICKALRDLWEATYTYAHKTMFRESEEAKSVYESTKAELMAVIKPTYAVAA